MEPVRRRPRKRPVLYSSSEDEDPQLPSPHQSASVDSVYETGGDETSITDNQSKMGYSLVPLPSIVKRVKQEDEDHLPDSFPFPKHYRPDVEACLEAKRFTTSARANFYTSIARAMFTYKRSPTSAEYVSVARQLIEKYPFLAPVGVGATYVSHT